MSAAASGADHAHVVASLAERLGVHVEPAVLALRAGDQVASLHPQAGCGYLVVVISDDLASTAFPLIEGEGTSINGRWWLTGGQTDGTNAGLVAEGGTIHAYAKYRDAWLAVVEPTHRTEAVLLRHVDEPQASTGRIAATMPPMPRG
jgi:hypothetical protein